MTAETTNAVLAIATGFLALTSVIGIFFTGFQIRIANLERRSLQRQHLYEIENSVITEFADIESATYTGLRGLLSILNILTDERKKADPSLERINELKSLADEAYLGLSSEIRKLHKIGGKLRVFMSNSVVSAASNLYLKYINCMNQISGTNADFDPDSTAKRYELVQVLIEKTREAHNEYVNVVRKELGIERLHEENLKLWTPSTPKLTATSDSKAGGFSVELGGFSIELEKRE